MSSTATQRALEKPQPAPRIFLTMRPDAGARSFLEWLAIHYRLYNYGRSGLSGMVRGETERASLALTMIFLFDLWAWSLVWNAILHRGVFVFDGRSLLAVMIGLLFAFMVLSFEQGFITMDTSVRRRKERAKLWAAGTLRFFAMLGSAYATAQPIELLVFANDIEQRAHQERAWEEVASRATEFQDLKNEIAGGGVTEIIKGEKDQAAENREEALAKKTQTKTEIDANSQERSMVEGQISALERELVAKRVLMESKKNQLDKTVAELGLPKERRLLKDNPQVEQPLTDLIVAEKGYAAADGKLKKSKDRIEKLTEGITDKSKALVGQEAVFIDWTAILEKEQKRLDTRLNDLESRKQKLRRWVSRVLNSSASDKQFSDGDYTFFDRPYSFAEQGRVLDDLYIGRPIQRHNLMSIDRKLLSAELQIGDWEKDDVSNKGDRANQAAVIRNLYWAMFVVALFIPCMGLLFKLTIHPQLSSYYSASYQASIGHPEALQYQQALNHLDPSKDGLGGSGS